MPSSAENTSLDRSIHEQRDELLRNYENVFAKPMAFLGLAWLALIVLQFVIGSEEAIRFFTVAIWCIFIADVAVRFVLAPQKIAFLKRNVLVLISLALPAFRLLQLGRIFALIPAWQVPLLQILAGLNRSMVALQSTMERRGMGYLLTLTGVVTLAGAAGMYYFEHGVHGTGVPTYGSSLWWTAMVMTTLGSDYFPHTVPGRILCFLLSVFAFSVFGYVTAAIASYFVNKDAADQESPVADQQTINAILAEVKALRAEIESLERRRA